MNKKPSLTLFQRLIPLSFFLIAFSAMTTAAEKNALESWINKADRSVHWEKLSAVDKKGFQCLTLKLHSQVWQGIPWTHSMRVVMPPELKREKTTLLFITGDGKADKLDEILISYAAGTGMIAACVLDVPNQPLFDGRKEDALIAYTLRRFLETGDKEWPLLFPMVKSSMRAMDSVQAAAELEWGQKIEKFIVTGASKRGWTTWLTGAVDERVCGIAPMVIDTLNMKVQLKWAQQVYGKQSEMIGDYTDIRLHERMDDPGVVRVRSWIDPWFYRERFTMPKLILLGTNDPYWTVDSMRHYYSDIPGPKLVHQTPNAGHNLGSGKEALQSLIAWSRLVADGIETPGFEWSFEDDKEKGTTTAKWTFSHPAKSLTLWKAVSGTRDFRNAKWEPEKVEVKADAREWKQTFSNPKQGFLAVMLEAGLVVDGGTVLDVSSRVKVLPDFDDPEVTRDSFNFRRPANDAELEKWLENMVVYHDFSESEVQLATGLTIPEIRRGMAKFKISSRKRIQRKPGDPLVVLPYPGGRHPRIGFLEGAIDPQRETKLSIFTPWDADSYVVADIPEAIWSNLGLTYLAHTHVETVWDKQGIAMEPEEWQRHADGSYSMDRTLPNGITFGTRAMPRKDGVLMEMWLKNGTSEALSGMRVQNCIMLKGAEGFTDHSNENKVFKSPFAAVRNGAGDKWVITAWTPCHRPWGNIKCPCMHSDPKFPDANPGQTVRLKGWLSFFEGKDIETELNRLVKEFDWLAFQ